MDVGYASCFPSDVQHNRFGREFFSLTKIRNHIVGSYKPVIRESNRVSPYALSKRIWQMPKVSRCALTLNFS